VKPYRYDVIKNPLILWASAVTIGSHELSGLILWLEKYYANDHHATYPLPWLRNCFSRNVRWFL